MRGDRWSAGTGSVYTALPLYMSEELADKTQRAGPARTFPSTSCLLPVWHLEPHPAQGSYLHALRAQLGATCCLGEEASCWTLPPFWVSETQGTEKGTREEKQLR